MKKQTIVLCITLLAVLQLTGQEMSKRIDEYVKTNMEDFLIPGLVISIVQGNQIMYSKAYGYKDVDTKEPLRLENIFHMASVSKSFSATAIMKLSEQGKIDLNAYLLDYLPYFELDDIRFKEIKIKQLLSHTSGMPDDDNYDLVNPPNDDSTAERYTRKLKNIKMISNPGEVFNYSNMAYDIIADIVSKVTGMTFEDYVKENILVPLKMDASDFLYSRIDKTNVTSSYILNATSEKGIYPYNRDHSPSSCLSSNIIDMSNWSIAFLNYGKFKGVHVIDSTTVVKMFTPQIQINTEQWMGLGWFIGNYKGEKIIFHGGGDFGYRNLIALIPDKSLAVVLASNYEATPNYDLTYGLIDIVLGNEPTIPLIPIRIPIGKAIINDGTQMAIKLYKHLKESEPNKYNYGEEQLRYLAGRLIRIKRTDDAIEILKLNAEMFPNSSNAFTRLASTYLSVGNKEQAVINFKKALEIDPQNANAVEQLKKLK